MALASHCYLVCILTNLLLSVTLRLLTLQQSDFSSVQALKCSRTNKTNSLASILVIVAVFFSSFSLPQVPKNDP